MRARSLLPLVATALLASACAGRATLSSSSSSSPSPTPAIVHVGFDRRNTTVHLHVNDLLVVELPEPSPAPVTVPLAIWRLTHYPPSLRARESDAKAGRFEFVAQSTGSGVVTAISGCSPGSAMADVPMCPLVAGIPPNISVLFSITVVVT